MGLVGPYAGIHIWCSIWSPYVARYIGRSIGSHVGIHEGPYVEPYSSFVGCPISPLWACSVVWAALWVETKGLTTVASPARRQTGPFAHGPTCRRAHGQGPYLRSYNMGPYSGFHIGPVWGAFRGALLSIVECPTFHCVVLYLRAGDPSLGVDLWLSGLVPEDVHCGSVRVASADAPKSMMVTCSR